MRGERSLNLFLDGMFYRCSGVGRVFENLLSAFMDCERVKEIAVILPVAHRDSFLNQFPSPKVKPVFVPYGPMGFGDLFRKGQILRSFSGKVGLFFWPNKCSQVNIMPFVDQVAQNVPCLYLWSGIRWVGDDLGQKKDAHRFVLIFLMIGSGVIALELSLTKPQFIIGNTKRSDTVFVVSAL